jgi:uncharacterized repeat protein (TIGR04076 family)
MILAQPGCDATGERKFEPLASRVVVDSMTEPADIEQKKTSEGILQSFDTRGGIRSRQMQRLDDAEKNYAIEASVIVARNCKVGHRVGEQFIFDVHGNLDSARCPERVCVYLIAQLVSVVARINEKLMQTGDFDDLYFLRYARCPDVGVENLGYGEVIVRTRMILA